MIEIVKHGKERGVRRRVELGASFGYIWVGLLALRGQNDDSSSSQAKELVQKGVLGKFSRVN